MVTVVTTCPVISSLTLVISMLSLQESPAWDLCLIFVPGIGW